MISAKLLKNHARVQSLIDASKANWKLPAIEDCKVFSKKAEEVVNKLERTPIKDQLEKIKK